MEIGVLINCINVICATLCFALANRFYLAVREKDAYIRYIMVIAGISCGLWNISLAGYGFAIDQHIARGFFSLLIISMQGYVMSMYFLVVLLLSMRKGIRRVLFLVGGLLLSLSDIVIYGFASNQEFITENGRTSYYIVMSPNAIYHFSCLIVIAVYVYVVVLRGMKKMKYKRDRRFIVYALTANIFVLLFTLPDTIMPSLGMPSFPSSGYGALVAYAVMLSHALHYNTFNLTTENLSRYVYSIVNNGILVFDNRMKLHLHNPYAQTMLGIPENKEVYLWDLFDISIRDADEMQEQVEMGEILYKRYKSKGTGISCSFTPAIAKDEYDEPYCMILVVSDMTKEDDMMEAVVQADRAKSDFLANMSHEIRTPINAVLGMNELVLRESKEDAIIGYAQDIERSGKALLSIINDILDFSKIESGKMEIVPVEYKLSTLIQDGMNMIEVRAEEKDIDVSLTYDETLPNELYGDEVRVRQTVINLLTNAVKYTPNGGKVIFDIQGEKKAADKLSLIVSVKDTGIGIKEEGMAELFTSFQRLDEKKNRNIEGTGLGLSITKQILDLMDGDIKVESVYGQGSTFTITVPQKIVSDAAIGDISHHAKQSAKAEQYHSMFKAPSARILVVDDTKMNLNVFAGLLKQTEMTIDKCLSGKEALELVTQQEYDLIFMDHMMPEMDGIETFERMKALEHSLNADTKTIMLSANAISGVREMYLSKGFADYLSKPVQGDLLEQMIMKYLPSEKLVMEEKDREVVADKVVQEETVKTKQETEALAKEVQEFDENAGLIERLSFLDTATALVYCANSEELYQEILADYVENTLVEELEADFTQKDVENYRIHVHALKSSSLTMGAKELSEHAKSLEMAAREQKWDVIENDHASLMAQYGEVLTKIKNALDSMKKA